MHRVTRYAAAWTLAATLCACGGDPEAPEPTSSGGNIERATPHSALPTEAPVETAYLPNDIYQVVCRLGHPETVEALPGGQRLVHFRGPFRQGDDPEAWDYLTLTIDGPERRWVSSSRWSKAEAIEFRSPKPGELSRYRLPRIQGVEPSINLVRIQVGDPTLVRDVDRGRQRYIFDRKICMKSQLLEGIYLDAEREQVVKARGIEHPRELKWILSGGRAPGPDPAPVHYVDVHPDVGSAQSVALAFIRRREAQDPEAARKLLWEDELQQASPAALLSPTRPGARIDDLELTYQTTRYGHDETRITVRFALEDSLGNRFPVSDDLVLRKRGEDWRVVDSRR